MKENQSNRMLKKDEMENRKSVAEIERPREEKAEEKPETRGFSCEKCHSPTTVIKTFPLAESHQHPVKWVRRRRYQCMNCGLKFVTLETLDANKNVLPR